jgi:N-acetylmuramoyl-L-alanine amidase
VRRRREWLLAIVACCAALATVGGVAQAWKRSETPSVRGGPAGPLRHGVASLTPGAATGSAHGGQALRATPAGNAPQSSASHVSSILAGKIVVIDPGHNPGNRAHPSEINRPVPFGAGMKPCDTTGTATNDGYAEATYTLDVAYRVVAFLRKAGARVVLTHTRTTPAWGPCITERAAIGNSHQAAAAISIHADGGPPSGHGFSTITPVSPIPAIGLTMAMVARDLDLAIAVRNAYASATGMPYSSYLGSEGIYASNAYGGTNLSRVPKIFIETGNMRNAADAAKLKSAAFRQRAARGIATGIARFIRGR